jgi:ABC-type sugar transport system permease subunit
MEQTNTQYVEKKSLKKRQKDMIFVACLVTLPLIHYLIFYVYVNFNSILLAFQRYDEGVYVWNGLANFERLINEFMREGYMGTCIKNSLIYYAVHTAVGTTATLFFSYYIFKKRFASKVFKVILFLPSIIASISITLMFKYITNFAIPELVLELFGKKIDGLTSTTATLFGTAVFYGIWVGFGSGLLLYSGAMSNISDSVMEASQIDGAGELRQFFTIVVPLIFPTLSTFLINGVAVIFSSDMHLYAFFGGGADRSAWTFGYYLLRMTREATMSEYPFPATVGIFLTVFSVPITFLFRYMLNKLGPKTV